MSGVVLGVDIGARGAIALFSGAEELLSVEDMSCLDNGTAGRRSVNAPLLAEIIGKSHAREAFVEFVGTRPGEGAVGAFAFGQSRGVVEGVLAELGIPATHIAPASWKRAVGLPAVRDSAKGAKDAARSEVIPQWPAKAKLFASVKDDGRAEAALIALADLKRRKRGL
jgi:hypothetical protein